jgi:hypothetical protein
LERSVAVGLEADREFLLRDFVGDLDVLLVGFRPVEILSNMDGAKIVHVLVDKLGDSDLGKVAVRLVTNEAHGEYVA